LILTPWCLTLTVLTVLLVWVHTRHSGSSSRNLRQLKSTTQSRSVPTFS
jgi:hypothetical protein